MADQKPQKPTGKSQRKLKNYFLDLRYQLKFTLTMVVIAGVLTAGLGYFIKKNASVATKVIEVTLMDPTLTAEQLAAAQDTQAQLKSADRLIIWELVGFGFLMSCVLSVYGIILTHKVAGPLFKVTLYLDKIRDGKLGNVYALRKGDELVEFFDHFKAAHDALRKAEQDDIELFERAQASVADPALKAEIAASIAKKVESLK